MIRNYVTLQKPPSKETLIPQKTTKLVKLAANLLSLPCASTINPSSRTQKIAYKYISNYRPLKVPNTKRFTGFDGRTNFFSVCIERIYKCFSPFISRY